MNAEPETIGNLEEKLNLKFQWMRRDMAEKNRNFKRLEKNQEA